MRFAVSLTAALAIHAALLWLFRPELADPPPSAGAAIEVAFGSAAPGESPDAGAAPASEAGGAEKAETAPPTEAPAPEAAETPSDAVAYEPEARPRPDRNDAVADTPVVDSGPEAEPEFEPKPEPPATSLVEQPEPPSDAAEMAPPAVRSPLESAERMEDEAEGGGPGDPSEAATAVEEAAGQTPEAGEGAGEAPEASGAGAAKEEASSNYAGAVMQHLSRIRRPRAESRGAAFVQFRVDPKGELERAAVSESSGSSRFDRAALRLVERAAPFPPPPPGVNRDFTVKIEGR